MKPRSLGLGPFLIGITLAIVAAGLLGSAFYSIRVEQQQTERELDERGQALAAAAAAAVMEPVLIRDWPNVQTLVDTLVTGGTAAFAHVERADSTLVAEANGIEPAKPIPTRSYSAFIQVAPDTPPLGVLTIGLDYSRAESILATRMRELAVSTFLTFTLITVGLSLALRRAIIEPIQLLDSHIERLGQGDLEAKVPMNHAGEFGRLAETIDEMRTRLRKTLNDNVELVVQLKDQSNQLREAQAELVKKERLAALGLLTGVVSHELRNPLGTILTSAHSLRRQSEENPRTQRTIDRIERSIQRCDRIIQELLSFSRTTRLVRETVVLEELVSDLLADHTTPAGIEVQFIVPVGDTITISADRDRLRRALINLINNACQAIEQEAKDGTPLAHEGAPSLEHASVAVEIGLKEGDAFIRVIDNGPGIPPDSIEKVLEPLFSTKSFGVGLGLPIVKQIIELHDGRMEIDSKVAEGTQITLWLPQDGPADTDDVDDVDVDAEL